MAQLVGAAFPINDDALFFLVALQGSSVFGATSTTKFTMRAFAPFTPDNAPFGYEWEFVGTDFTNFTNGFPASGTITALTVRVYGPTVVSLTDINISAATFFNFLNTNQFDSIYELIFAGNDKLTLSAAADTFNGRGGNDIMLGMGGNDFLVGGAGDDTLEGGDGDDRLDIGPFSFDNGDDRIFGGSGNDSLNGWSGTNLLDGGAGNDEITSIGFRDTLVGGSGDDFLKLTLTTRTTAFRVKSSELLSATTFGLQFGDGTVVGGFEKFSIVLGSSSDVFELDTVVPDWAAQINGGTGNDQFFANLANIAYTPILLVRQAGSLYSLKTTNSAVTSIIESFERLYVIGGGGADSLMGGGSLDILRGSGGNDTLRGEEGGDSLDGDEGDDALFGGDGDDSLSGSRGADILDGGTGFDFASYANSTTGLTLFMGGGTFNSGEANGDTHIAIEGLTGSQFSDIIGGDAGVNELDGLNGNDFIYGRGGTDTLLGGGGNDVLSGGLEGDRLDGGAGIDVAFYREAATGFTANMQTGVGTGEAAGDTYFDVENIWGSDFDDVLTGNNGAGQVYGFAGNDNLSGLDGDDFFYGGVGNDTMTGGAGIDSYFFLSWNDKLNQFGTPEPYEGGDVWTDFTSGTDRIILSRFWFGFGNIGGPAAALTETHANFVTNGVVGTNRPSLIWNANNRTLSFDADGNGATQAVLLGTLQQGATLALSDIWTA